MRTLGCVWNVMAQAQKPNFVSRRNGRVHLNRRGCQFSSRLLAGELCTSACRVCTARASLCSAVMWRLVVTHSILSFPLHFSSRQSACAITFQLDVTYSAPHTVESNGKRGLADSSLHRYLKGLILQVWHYDLPSRCPVESWRQVTNNLLIILYDFSAQHTLIGRLRLRVSSQWSCAKYINNKTGREN
jgi:hypothetical protein